ncbi:hypothetical protein CCH79_00009752 [Gambusia affinis]|uniref:KID domain-containing protein n=1 Tax=Gambusia affinis TaxID=33528 RepID=A0A315W2J7_GAMAF|nr:hypothetical protein CCH79_00009752 [Gambusia affinis]
MSQPSDVGPRSVVRMVQDHEIKIKRVVWHRAGVTPCCRPFEPPEGSPSAAGPWPSGPSVSHDEEQQQEALPCGMALFDNSGGSGGQRRAGKYANASPVTMDSSVSSQLESSLNDSVTDGEKDQGEANASPADSSQVLLQTESEVAVVQLSDGQTTSVQGVIQAPQTSVIQSPQVQTVQIVTVAELEDDRSVTNTQKRRELLSRRPSYRKILNELSSDSPAVPKIDEEKGEDDAAVSSSSTESVPNSIYQTSSGQYIAIAQGRAIPLTSPAVETLQGAQTLTVTGSPNPQTGAAILQAADSSHQFFIQGGQVLIQGSICGSSSCLPLCLTGSRWLASPRLASPHAQQRQQAQSLRHSGISTCKEHSLTSLLRVISSACCDDGLCMLLGDAAITML